MKSEISEIEAALRRLADAFKATGLLAPIAIELASMQQAYLLSSHLNNGYGAMLGELDADSGGIKVGDVVVRWPSTSRTPDDS